MQKRFGITDAELPIMEVLWKNGRCTSQEILKQIPGNSSTIKTFLLRLVQRGSVAVEEINARTFIYKPVVTRQEFAEYQLEKLIARCYGGSAEELLRDVAKKTDLSGEDLLKIAIGVA